MTTELIEAHKQQDSVRSLQRLLHSRNPAVAGKELFQPGDPVCVFYKSSKHTEPVEWVRATVVEAEEHTLVARRCTRGPPMRVAYEDARFTPRGPLTSELLTCSLEDALADPGDTTASETPPCHMAHAGHTPSPPPEFTSCPDDPLPPAPAQVRPSTLLATPTASPSACTDSGEKDIGEYSKWVQAQNADCPKPLQRDNSKQLEEIYEVIGSKQVSASHLSFAGPWIMQEALQAEHDLNSTEAYKEIPEIDVPRGANVISSHVVYSVKTEEDGSRMMKARIVPHGNHDDEKDDVRKDSSNAPLFVIRLLLSLVTFLGFRIGTADIKGAFLQSGPINRDIYVRPPRGWQRMRGILWKLL